MDDPDLPDATLPNFSRVRTPGFEIRSERAPSGEVLTDLKRESNPATRAFDNRFPRILSDLDALRARLVPGFSDLRDARLRQVENARSSAVGNLRDSLAQRRVLGSSFGDDAVIRAELAFAEEAANQEALSFLEEVDANSRLLAFESEQMFSGLERDFAELGLSADFSLKTADLFSRNLQFENQVALEEAAQSNAFTGGLIGTGLGFVSGGLRTAAGAGAFDSLFNQSGPSFRFNTAPNQGLAFA